MVFQDVEQPAYEDLELLAEVSQLLALPDSEGLFHRVMTLAANALGATGLCVFLPGDHDHTHPLFAAAGSLSTDDSIPIVRAETDDGLVGWVIRNQAGTLVFDTESDDRWFAFPDPDCPVRSLLCVPLLSKERVQAVCALIHPEPSRFTDYHLQLMTIVVNQLSLVLGNSDHNRTQQQRLQSVLDTLPDSVLMLDAEGRITDLNQAALSLLGATHPVEATGRPISDFVALDAVFAPIRQVIVEYDSTVMHRTFAARSDRHWHDYQVTMSGWKDSRWGLGGHIVVLHDSTDLRDLDRFKDEVLRIAASDLRSPLGVIAGYMELIALDTPDVTSPVHQYLGVIRRSTEQMKAMLDELLRVERVINSPLALQEATDFAKLVKVVLVNLRPLADDKNQSFEADLDLETVPRAAVDPVLLRLAMENLIDNAIRFTPEGGQVVVRAYVSDDRFHFETEDTGIGIAPEHLPRVFELFYRIPTETEGEEPGMGLGLSLVRNVVERHQGKVWARSQPGTGSQFGFSLPLS